MSDAFSTERPTPLSLFQRPFVDTPPKPQKSAWSAYKARRDEYATDLANRISAHPKPRVGHFTVFDLCDGVCRYPTSDAPFLFCGAATAKDQSYCAAHLRICIR